MKHLIILFAVLALCIAAPKENNRMKRAAWEFAADAEFVIGDYKTDFSCAGLKYGYYGDIANDCKVFHICHPIVLADGTEQIEHYSFFCGNQTVFDQFSSTCAHPDEAVPCGMSTDFHYLNDRYGTEEDFHRDEDVKARDDILSTAYGRRAGK